ncbi:MAG: methyl-accepting chemotaxis protein [Bacteroidota bacterium]
MKIGMKLGTAFAFLGFVILVIIYLGLNTASNMNKEIKDLAYDKFKKTVWANDIINQLNIVSRAVRNAIITENIQTRNDEIKRLEPAAKIVSQRMDSLNANIQDEKGKLLLNELAIIRKDYFGAREKLLKLIDSKNKKEIEDYLFGDFRKAQNAYIDKITEIINYQGDLFNETAQNAEKSYNAQFTLMSIIGALSILIAILMAIFVTRGITKPIGKAVEAAENIARGNMNVDLETNTKDETGMLINAMKTMSQNIGKLLKEMNRVANAAVEGKLDTRGNSGEFAGEYQNIVLGFNATLDAVIGPLNVTAEYVDRISKGDIPPKITDEYKGDFNEIKNNLNTCIDAVNLLVSDAHSLARAAVEGRLDTRADASKHQGDFRKIVQGVNDTLDAVIGPLNVAAEYVDRISKGDIPPKITDEYKGDFNEIKNNLNTCIDAINLLISDVHLLALAAVDGRLDTRADALKHQGDFRKIVQGVNDTLNAVIEPIKEASQVLGIMATGDLTARMLGDYRGDLAKLKQDINMLADSLSGLIRQVNELVDNTASSATEISATAEGLAAASQEQSAQADEVASAVEQMSRTITENAMAANKTAEVAQENGRIASEGGQVVSQTVDKMRDIAKVVKNSAENIEKLGESSKQIGEIISVIDDIADQTNLLALNAAIEAARAGEQGRGFAVVADEVRKLAERTTEATKQIAVMIKGIQSETEAAVIAMNKGTTEVTSGIELADKAGQSLKQILNSTQEVIDMINRIAAASEEQSATSEQISKNVTSISQVTAESAKRVEDVAHTAEDLAKMTNQLADLMRQFKIDEYSSNMPMRQLSRNRAKQLESKLG